MRIRIGKNVAWLKSITGRSTLKGYSAAPVYLRVWGGCLVRCSASIDRSHLDIVHPLHVFFPVRVFLNIRKVLSAIEPPPPPPNHDQTN